MFGLKRKLQPFNGYHVMVGAAVAGAATTAVVSNALAPSGGGGGGAVPTSQAAGIADPFAAQRPQYQSMLQQLMTNPASFQGSPGYQWQFNQGMEAVNRTAGAQHMLGSGNRLQELMQYGQGMASQDYNNQFLRLANLAGASAGQPGTAGQLQAGYNQQMSQGAGQLAGAIGQGVSGMFSSGSNTGMIDTTGMYTQPNYFGSSGGGTYPSGGSTYFMDPATFSTPSLSSGY